MVTLNINGKNVQLDATAEMPLLWALRDVANLTGTKYSCGMALCGACTIHLDGQPVHSCVTPISASAGKKITTVEAMAESKAVQKPGAISTSCNAATVNPAR